MCVCAYGHAHRRVCVWHGTELLPFLEAPPGAREHLQPSLFHMPRASQSHSIINSGWLWINKPPSLFCLWNQPDFFPISFYDFITQSKRLNLQAKRPQVDHLGVTMLVQFHVMIAERKLGLISHQMSHNKGLFVGDVFSIWYNPLTSLHILRFSCMVFTENAAHNLHSSSFPKS